MTYKELLKHLIELTDEQLKMNVTLYNDEHDEFCEGTLQIIEKDDRLDVGHPVLTHKHSKSL